MMRRTLLLALLFLILALPLPAFADDGYLGGVGEIPIPRNSNNIAMKREVVNIILHEGFAEVECAYQFKNHGDAQTVLMGFPEHPHMGGDFVPITVFRAFVDGIEVPAKKTKISLKPDQYGYDQFEATSNWFTQEIPFKAGETKVVVNRYLAPHGGTNSPNEWHQTNFAYILHTGSTWMGRISRADVNVVFASDVSWDNFKPDPKNDIGPTGIMITPKDYTRLEDGMGWTFTNIEPKPNEYDIGFTLYRNRGIGGSTPLDTSADSYLVAGEFKYPPEQAFDGDITTAWAENKQGSGIGQSIKASFKKPSDIAEVRILPGYAKRPDLFTKYSRPKKLTLALSDGTVKHITLADDTRVQYFELDKPVKATWAKLTIDDAYNGSVGNNIYITEIEFAPSKTRTVASAEDVLTGKPSSTATTETSQTAVGGQKGNGSAESTQATSTAASASKKQNEKTPPNSLFIALIAFAFGAIVAIAIVFGRKQKDAP